MYIDADIPEDFTHTTYNQKIYELLIFEAVFTGSDDQTAVHSLSFQRQTATIIHT